MTQEMIKTAIDCMKTGTRLESDVLTGIVSALEKQMPQKPIEYGKYGFSCPCCNSKFDLEKEDIYLYGMIPPEHCEKCGQALAWE